MSSFLFQNTIQLTLLGMHQCSHVVPQTFKSYCNSQYGSSENFWLASLHTSPLSWLIAFKLILRDFFFKCSRAVKLHNFWGPKIDKEVINSSTKMSDFCENCNPHSSYHSTAIDECLVDIWFAARGGGYSTLGWVRMCGPKFRSPPYNKTREDANLQPITKPFASWRTFLKPISTFYHINWDAEVLFDNLYVN